MSPMYACIKTLNHTPQTCLNSARIFIRKVVGKDGFEESNSISIHVVILYGDTGCLKGPQLGNHPD